ncbi:unnamed protein product [Symbiodinium natans]|uniref:Sulfotransferase n=1 Tax=Symbiodinium natans TaxID=878477 RepID=A0A812QZ97_9DINO|nr:unnamed protein product [Symbiodinium natans]
MYGAFLALCAVPALRVAADETCSVEYEQGKRGFKAISLNPLLYTPISHRPDWHWKQLLRSRGIDADKVSQYEEAWVGLLFAEAEEAITGCSIQGGRYWDLVLDLRKLYDLARGSAKSSLVQRLASAFRISAIYARESLPENLRLSVCTPAVCDADQVIRTIYPEFTRVFMGARPERMLGNATFRDVVDGDEVLRWDAFDIDFAIVGVDRCGTTSLRKNLEMHPDIVFKSDREDLLLSHTAARRLLPTRAQVDQHNAEWHAAKAAKWKRTGHEPRRAPPLVGMANPLLFPSALARDKMAAMPRLKLIVVLCDPVGRFEKLFMLRHYCHDDLRAAQKRFMAHADRDGTEVCYRSTSAIVTERKGYWQMISMAPHLATLAQRFSGRIFFLHQDELRDMPRSTFDSLVGFLGLPPFPEDANFRRYNSVGGHRTDLCSNASLVSALKELLEHEYVMQEQLLRIWGKSVHVRTTRCDWIDKVNTTYCPNENGQPVAC